MYSSILILQSSYSLGLSIGTFDAATICAVSESISSSKEILYIQTGICDLPKDRKSIGGKWVFKIKYKSNGEIERYKARYVVKGYNQNEGIDFDETFSLIVKIVTVRCLLNIAIKNNWSLFQLVINHAFLYGDLHETVYMDLPEGFYSSDDKRVCKLKKSLYGLKQAPRQWNAKLTQTLVECGFKQSNSDYSLFTKNNVDEIKKFKEFLRTKFQIKDLGKLKYFLGIEVLETDLGICLSQRKYCLDLLSEYGLLACKPSATPLEQNLAIRNEPTEIDKTKKQHTLAKSPAEAEYIAMASVTSVDFEDLERS
ncbi:ribonuclease H-like domain-containing protein [Tanacetum coccineum]